jgi:DNA-binding IclR family transcriptional regulator
MPYLEDLHVAIGQHVQLGVLAGNEVLFIERLSARNAVVNSTVIGGRVPIYASAAGLAILAFETPEMQEDILCLPMRGYTDKTIVDRDTMRRSLAGIRRMGYMVADEYIHSGTTAIAAPVYGLNNAAVAAVTIVIPSGDNPRRRYLPQLLAATRGISRSLASFSGA